MAAPLCIKSWSRHFGAEQRWLGIGQQALCRARGECLPVVRVLSKGVAAAPYEDGGGDGGGKKFIH